jgi:hypothetical protein
LRCLPAIIAPLLYGVVYDKPVQSLLAAAGAMSVGFGSFQRLYQSRLAPMLIASVSMAASAFVGTQIGHWSAELVVAAGVWGFLCGLSASVGPGATYIGTQSIIFLLVATSFPMPPNRALPLVSLVLSAGLLQTLIISLFRLLSRSAVLGGNGAKRRPQRLGPLRGARLALHTIRRTTTRREAVFRHAVRLGLAMIISTALARIGHQHHSYWMPMTTGIILQQDLNQTLARALSRVGGTLLGVGIATLIAALLRPEHGALIVIVAIFAWLSYSMLRVNYFVFAGCITGYIVFLLAFAGLPELSVVVTRAAYTTLGAAIALLAYAIRRRHTGHRRSAHESGRGRLRKTRA